MSSDEVPHEARRRRWPGVILVAVALLSAVVVLPLARKELRKAWWRGYHGNVPGYNMYFGWRDDYERGFRGVIYPRYLNPDSLPYTYYGSARVENRKRFRWRDWAPVYAGERIEYPEGKDTAVIAPDGGVTFIRLAPDYLNYGPGQTTRVWGIFERQKQFSDWQHGLNVEELEAAGLLPSWARFASERPASAVPAATSSAASTTQAP